MPKSSPALLLVVLTGSAAFTAITFSVYNACRNFMIERSLVPRTRDAKVPQFESYSLPKNENMSRNLSHLYSVLLVASIGLVAGNYMLYTAWKHDQFTPKRLQTRRPEAFPDDYTK